jgi:hypothetical protein
MHFLQFVNQNVLFSIYDKTPILILFLYQHQTLHLHQVHKATNQYEIRT